MVLNSKKEVVRENLELPQGIKIQLFKHYQLILTLLFYFFLQRVWFIKSKHGKFLRGQQAQRVNLYLIFYL